jgi:transcriptional regulator with XRE-family HTH domain
MPLSRLIARARCLAGLSKRALARRAGTSAAALVQYEHGRRSPTVATLDRVLDAAGVRADVSLWRRVDPDVAGRRLAEVLALADVLPQRPADRRLRYPRFPG